MASLSKMTEAELLAENERLMAAKADAVAPLKASQSAIQLELNRRRAAAKVEATLAALPAAERNALLDSMKASAGQEDSDG